MTSEFYSKDILDKNEFWNNELLKVGKEFLYGCSTGLYADWLEPYRPTTKRQGIHEGHAYSIMDAVEHVVDGKTYRLVKIRYLHPSPGFSLLSNISGILGAAQDGVVHGVTVLQNGRLNGWNDWGTNLEMMEYVAWGAFEGDTDNCRSSGCPTKIY